MSFRALFSVIPSQSEESSMDSSLRSVQNDKTEKVIPSQSEESSVWMLRLA